jgi:protein O-GlcNAc transferase
MTETLFERYKEALRAGHVAVLQGRLEDAAAFYRAAIAVAGDRAVPRTALGGVLLRLGEPAEALAAYDAALALLPGDDAALLGRAQALVVLRRTDEAAATYDRLVAAREAAGREADAVEAARRALAIEPTDERRRRHAELAGGEVPGAGAPGAAGDGAADAPVEPEPEPEPPVDAEALVAEAEAAVARADGDAAATAALAAARAHRDAGRRVAAIDACLLGIGARPADVDLHLLLVDLAGDSAEAGPSDTRHRLLRLAELDGDAAAIERVRAAVVAASDAGALAP